MLALRTKGCLVQASPQSPQCDGVDPEVGQNRAGQSRAEQSTHYSHLKCSRGRSIQLLGCLGLNLEVRKFPDTEGSVFRSWVGCVQACGVAVGRLLGHLVLTFLVIISASLYLGKYNYNSIWNKTYLGDWYFWFFFVSSLAHVRTECQLIWFSGRCGSVWLVYRDCFSLWSLSPRNLSCGLFWPVLLVIFIRWLSPFFILSWSSEQNREKEAVNFIVIWICILTHCPQIFNLSGRLNLVFWTQGFPENIWMLYVSSCLYLDISIHGL